MATKDKYANILTQEITMSAADTLTFTEVSIGLSIFDKVGILISRIEYHPSVTTMNLMIADDDKLFHAVTTTNTLASLNAREMSILDYHTLNMQVVAAGSGVQLYETPIVRDFANLPGGGLLITPRPWYVALSSTSLGTAGVSVFRFFFTVVKLTPQDYFELLETRTYFG